MSLKFKFAFISILTLIALVGVLSYLAIRTIRLDTRASIRELNLQVTTLIHNDLEKVLQFMRERIRALALDGAEDEELASLERRIARTSVESQLEILSFRIHAIENQQLLEPAVFTYTNPKLGDFNLAPSRLLSERERGSIAKRFLSDLSVQPSENPYLLLNSTVEPELNSILFVTPLSETRLALVEFASDPILKSFQSASRYRLYLLDQNSNILVHSLSDRPSNEITYRNLSVIQRLEELEPDRPAVLEFQSEAYSGGRSERVFGVLTRFGFGGLSLIVEVPTSTMLESQRRIEMQALVILVIGLLLAVQIMVLFSSTLTRPLEDLAQYTLEIAKGNFNRRIPVRRKDEIGRLALSFNSMCEQLSQRENALEETKKKLIQSEKMSAFGQMSAGIAHEVKNPLASILGYAQLTKKRLDTNSSLVNYIDIIEKETQRCKEIVDNLMRFARQEKSVQARMDLHATIKNAVRLVDHQMKVSSVQVVVALVNDGAPVYVNGNVNNIQQVLMNLMLNAQHAMPSGGSLTVSTQIDFVSNEVSIRVSDTGHGMSEQVKSRIFEPFFTTKEAGKGTGLGLSVSYGIIKDHQGRISVESQVGVGTTFTIVLPLASADAKAGAA